MSPRVQHDLPILGLAGSSPLGPRTMVFEGHDHLLSVCKPGGGKTQTIVLPNLFRRACSAVLVDFQDAQIAKAVALARQHVLGQPVWMIDPMGITPSDRMPTIDGKLAYATINPIGMIARSSNPSLTAQMMWQTLLLITGNDPHWSEGAQMTMSGIAVYVATDPRFPEEFRTLQTVWDILTDEKAFQIAIRLMRRSTNLYVRDVANAYTGLSEDDREMKGIRSNLRVQIGALLGDPGIMRTLCSDTVNYRELNRRPMTIILVTPGNYSVVMMRYVRLVLWVIVSEMEAGGIRPFDSIQPPTLFMIDEFNTLGNFPQFVDAMARGRNFGLHAHLLIQSLGQIADTYKDGYRSLMGNMGIVQYFGGTADEHTAEEISRLSGEKSIIAPSVSYSHGGREGHSESYSVAQRRIYKPDEVMRLPLPKQLVSYTGVGMAEGTLFRYGMQDFPDYQMFMSALKNGMKPEDAGSMVRRFQGVQAEAFRQRAARYQDQRASQSAPPAPPRRHSIGWRKTIDRGFAGLFGDDTDF